MKILEKCAGSCLRRVSFTQCLFSETDFFMRVKKKAKKNLTGQDSTAFEKILRFFKKLTIAVSLLKNVNSMLE
jgi:hypothetical protein